MITEDYCSFEVAKLLKEKGFDEPCTELNKILCKEGEKPVMRITHQKAMKWLRKVHSLHVQINYMHGAYQEYDYVVINTFSGIRWHEPISFSSYEEAVEAALKYSLENLI